MEMESCVPPGFRFHPTEEELVGYYLKRKINALKIDLDVIIDIDLYKIEPWDIQASCKLGYSEQNEWYFFSHKDKKYPTGTRTNRATASGFWKATGRDKAVLSKNQIIGMRKTLVFYNGRAPNGRKTDWIMHEYRHQTSEHAPPHEEGWVVCRAFRKPVPSHLQRPGYDAWNNNNQSYYPNNNNNNMFVNNFQNNNTNSNNQASSSYHNCYASAQELVSNNNPNFSDVQSSLHEALPQLDSPSNSVSASFGTSERDGQSEYIDWKNIENLLASQMDYPAPFPGADLPSTAPQSYQQEEAQGQHFLGCFPDL